MSNGSENGGPPREARLARVKDHAGYGWTPATAGRVLHQPRLGRISWASQREDLFSVSVLLLIQIKRRAGAFVALDPAFCALFSTDVVQPWASK
jgi:hypothetical protein